mmetsp:Transcript_11815/g.17591  ORF Transcript_11815/g.17591 Transcript_11815/m.17591 type:complete len:502 (+) Transcript_11815:67-1572(+)
MNDSEISNGISRPRTIIDGVLDEKRNERNPLHDPTNVKENDLTNKNESTKISRLDWILSVYYVTSFIMYLIVFSIYLSSIDFNDKEHCVEYERSNPFRYATYVLGSSTVILSIIEWKRHHTFFEVEIRQPFWIGFLASVILFFTLSLIERQLNAFPMMYLAVFLVESKATYRTRMQRIFFPLLFLTSCLTYVGVLLHGNRCTSTSLYAKILHSVGISLECYGLAKIFEFSYFKFKYPQVNILIDLKRIVHSGLRYSNRTNSDEKNSNNENRIPNDSARWKYCTTNNALVMIYLILSVGYNVSTIFYILDMRIDLDEECVHIKGDSSFRFIAVGCGLLAIALGIVEWMWHYRPEWSIFYRFFWFAFLISSIMNVVTNIAYQYDQRNLFALQYLAIFLLDSKSITRPRLVLFTLLCLAINFSITYVMYSLTGYPCTNASLNVQLFHAIGTSLVLYSYAKMLFELLPLKIYYPHISILAELHPIIHSSLRRYKNIRNSCVATFN